MLDNQTFLSSSWKTGYNVWSSFSIYVKQVSFYQVFCFHAFNIFDQRGDAKMEADLLQGCSCKIGVFA